MVTSIFKKMSRLCLFIMTACVLVWGGTAFLAPVPVHATCGINLFPPATEGQNYSTLVTSTSTGAGFTCKVVAFDVVYTNPPLPFPWTFDPGTAMFRCSPPIGSAGQYTICFQCQEYDASASCYPCCGGQCYPSGCIQCQKCTTLTVNPAYYPPTPTPTPTPTPAPTTFDYSVGIASGLTSGTAQVSVNGSVAATLAGGETKTIEGTKGENYNVNVPSTIQGGQGIRFQVKGSPAKTVNYQNPSAVFDYTAEYYVEFKTSPANVAQIAGTNWYAAGTPVSSTTPALVRSESDKQEYNFAQWTLPGGGTSLSKDIAFTVNGPGTYTAVYNSSPIAGSPSNLWWIIILIIVILAAGIAIGLLAMSRKKQAEETTISKRK
jgi:hypothetical protein